MIEIIERAKHELLKNGIKPEWIRVSPNVHELLAIEISRGGRKPIRIFEICGLRLEIDLECPSQGAYTGGTEDENWEEKTKNVLGRGKRIQE